MEDFMASVKEHIQLGIDQAIKFMNEVYNHEESKKFGIDLNCAAEKLGEKLKKKISIIEDNLSDITEISEAMEVSGLSFYTKDHSGIIIVVEENDYPFRKRFTIAHELGHIFMDDLKDGKSILFRSLNEGMDEDYYIKEQKANAFASEILMPTKQVEFLLKHGANFEEMAKIFGVSYSAMKNKINSVTRYNS